MAGGRVVELAAPPPLGAKVLPGPSPSVVLIGTGATLLEGDELAISLDVGPGASLSVTSVAAQLAHPCPSGGSTALRLEARLAKGAQLTWRPEPLVACAGCRHRQRADLVLQAGAAVTWFDELVLGRSGEPVAAIDLVSELRADLEGRPLLRDGLSTVAPGFSGPAVAGDARYLATVAFLGACFADPPWYDSRDITGREGAPGHRGGGGNASGVARLAGPGWLARVVASDVVEGRRLLHRCPPRS